MKTLITGGAGFVGTEIIKKWKPDRRDDLIILDKNNERIQELSINYPAIQFILGDASNVRTLTSLLANNQVTRLVHLAANSDIKGGAESTTPDFKDTLKTTVAIAEILKFYPVKKVYFSSTSAVYGSTIGPISAKKISIKSPESNYGWAKLASEQILSGVSKLKGISLMVVRFPNVVGSAPTHGILYDFKNKLIANPNYLEVLGDGTQEKPYIHVSDLVNVMLRMFELEMDLKWIPPLEINISPGDTISVKDIVNEVLKISDLNPSIAWGKTPQGWAGDIPNYEYEDVLPSEFQDVKIRNSRDAVRDSFWESWKT